MSSNNRNRRRARGVGMGVSAAFAAALASSAATAHADISYPTPIGDGFNVTDSCVVGTWQALETQYYQDFSVPNDPSATFEGLVREDSPFFGYSGIASDNNVYVEQVISGNVSVGEQYNSLNFGGPGSSLDGFHLVYDNLGGTPEADPASTVPSLGDPPPADLDPFQDLFGDTGINSWTPAADSYLATIDPTNALATNFDASVDNFVGGELIGPAAYWGQYDLLSLDAWSSDPEGAFSISGDVLTPLTSTADLALGADYALFATGLAPTVEPAIQQLLDLPGELEGGLFGTVFWAEVLLASLLSSIGL